MRRIGVSPAGVAVAMLLLSAGAWAAGGGELTGTFSLKVPKCGSEGSAVIVDLSLFPNNTFSASWAAETFTGTYSTGGRVAQLAFDGSSQTDLADLLESEISDVCGTSVTVTSIKVTQAMLKLNKAAKAAKLQIKIAVSGEAANGNGEAKYQLNGSGSWSIGS